MDLLPGNATGIPLVFKYHPFHFLDFKEQARTCKQAPQRLAERTTEVGKWFYMDFGFMRSSWSDYTHPNKRSNRVIQLWDGYSSYLLIVDKASRYIWVFLTSAKDPPVDIIDHFLTKLGHADDGSIWTDQGGKLAGLLELRDMILHKHSYILNQRVLIALPRIGPQKTTMINSLSTLVPFFKATVFLLNIGCLLFFMLPTYITLWLICPKSAHHSKASMARNLI